MSGGDEAGVRRTSQYVSMSDGVRVAVDLWLPGGLADGERIGTVMRATRYWRASVDAADTSTEDAEAELITSRRLALVTVDVRGTGASFGTWTGPWSRREIADLGEVVDWIVQHGWSNGRVGAHGVSYDGNTAELLASTGRRAVVAVAPRFADYDPWAHLSFPGGVMLEGFLAQWAAGNAALDRDDTSIIAGSVEEAAELRLVYGHPRPVDTDNDRSLLRAAVAEHAANLDVFETGTRSTAYDDDASLAMGYPSIAPFSHRAAIDENGTRVLGVASWFDAGTASGALARFCSSTGPQQVIIGAWSHGGEFDADPLHDGTTGALDPAPSDPPVADQRSSIADWLADRLGDAPSTTDREVRYYVCGRREWRTTDIWPPRDVVEARWHLSADGTLVVGSAVTGSRHWAVAPDSSSGPANRWMTQAGGGPVDYGDRTAADERLVHWTSPVIDADITVIGSPVVSVELATTADDGLLIAYLEVVEPEGVVRMLTEGEVRFRHRATGEAPYAAQGPYHPCTAALAAPMIPGIPVRIELALFPLAVRVRAGSRIRLAFAGHDIGTFVRVPAEGDPEVTVLCGPDAVLTLPVLGAGVEP